jgi:OHCU decarboxylase
MNTEPARISRSVSSNVATSAAPRIRSVPIEPHLMTLDALNVADEAAFVNALGFIFEDSPWVAARAWQRRPFADVAALHAAMCAIVAAAPLDERLALIRAHPDLVGRGALRETLSPASANEQAAAGLDRLGHEEATMFARLNAAYTARFGFPFVICVRENKKAAIVAGLESRIRNDRATEIATALIEIEKIARLRLEDAVFSNPSRPAPMDSSRPHSTNPAEP